MFTLHQLRCSICENIFCCSEHRRKHVNSVHGKHHIMIQENRKEIFSKSFTMKTKRTYLNLENKSGSKKRNFPKTEESVKVNIAAFDLTNLNKREFLMRRKPRVTNGHVSRTFAGSKNDSFENNSSVQKQSLKKNLLLSPTTKIERMITTSTPIFNKSELEYVGNQLKTSLKDHSALFSLTNETSSIETVQGNSLGILQEKKVTFSDSIDSLYITAISMTSSSKCEEINSAQT